jgi:hypothetical protein
MNLVPRFLSRWGKPPPPPVPAAEPVPEAVPLPTVVRKGILLRRQAFFRPEPVYSEFGPLLPIFQKHGQLVRMRVKLSDNDEVIEFEEYNLASVHLIDEGDPVLVRFVSNCWSPLDRYAGLDGTALLNEVFPSPLQDLPSAGDYVRQGVVVRLRPPAGGCSEYALAVRIDDEFGTDFCTYSQAADSSAGLLREGDRVAVHVYRSFGWSVIIRAL